MQSTIADRQPEHGPLPVILVAAVIQGWVLYGLHVAVAGNLWPAHRPGLLLACYTVAVFVPVTIQLLAAFARSRRFWELIALLSAAFFWFGWQHGSTVGTALPDLARANHLPFVIPLAALWLMGLPFLGSRLATGLWTAEYREFFTRAWRNKLLLAEAALFTGMFWLLLFLCTMLFRLLGIEFFQELFREPVFIYPVTAIVFGIALHLIGSVERFVGVVLEQILGLFKWLGVLAGLILALFSLALLVRLPELLSSDTRIIGAAWLLWLVAVMVLLLNAAYRDGCQERPYPAIIATGLRTVVPLLVLVAGVALYSIGVRVAAYGLTIERFWAIVVATAALVYASGYASAALRTRPWMHGIGRVNVIVALGLIAILALALTPLLSPYRLAADSQYRRVLAGDAGTDPVANGGGMPWNDSYRALRFDTGRYGLERLDALASLQDHPEATAIRERAAMVRATTDRWMQAEAPIDPASLRVFPAGRSLDPELLALLRFPTGSAPTETNPVPLPAMTVLAACSGPARQCAGLYVDLDGDDSEEFVLLSHFGSQLFVRREGRWVNDPAAISAVTADWNEVIAALEAGDFGTQPSPWLDLKVGDRVFPTLRVQPDRRPPRPASPPP